MNDLEARVHRQLGPLERVDVVLLAVSGGADSTAMMHLVARWARARGATPPVHVATIDHGLRPEARTEADAVASAASGLGLPHHVATWAGPHPTSGVAAAARTARYRLLSEIAERLRPHPAATVAVLTAHTADDQAETVLMRLARGSGPDGLAGMASVRPQAPGIWLHRPLLALTKARLMDWLRAQGIRWIEDPTNADLEYERPRWRAARPVLDSLGLSTEALTTAARRQAAMVATLDAALAAWSGRPDAVIQTRHGDITIDRRWLATLPIGLRHRLVARAIAWAGGQAAPLPLAAFEQHAVRFDDPLAATGPGRQGFTLHGAEIDLAGDLVRIRREALDARVPLAGLASVQAALPLQPSATIIWDRRFLVTLAADALGPVTVGPLTADGLNSLVAAGAERPSGVPARTLWTTPVLRGADGSILVAPFLAYYRSPWRPEQVRLRLANPLFAPTP